MGIFNSSCRHHLFCMIILLANHRALNALLMGDETAGTLGFNVGRLQKMLVLVSS